MLVALAVFLNIWGFKAVIEKAVFIEPTTDHFSNDRLFDTSNAFLNRDGTLEPFARLKRSLAAHGVPLHTADLLHSGRVVAKKNYYYSIGMQQGYKKTLANSSIQLSGFFLMEPPLVVPSMYQALPELSKYFQRIYVHNTEGDQYDLDGVDRSKLEKFYWPQPYEFEREPYWGRLERSSKLVVIAGNHRPKRGMPEYYSRRIHAVSDLEKLNAVDLYGRGWEKWWSRHSLWLPYWTNRKELMATYRGSCPSKLDVLSQYKYSLCFENMPMAGYVTEKIFDCLYAGTVPVYWGATDIERYIPCSCFVDMRKFSTVTDMYKHLQTLSEQDWLAMRDAGRAFLRGEGGARYFNGFVDSIVQHVLAD
jgi:hypothetical protein